MGGIKLKNKIIGILVCMLMIATALPVIGTMNEITAVDKLSFNISMVEEWNNTYGGTNWEIPLAGVQQIDSGYYLSGMTESYGAGSRDVWIIKTGDDGEEVWNRTFGRDHCDCGWVLFPTSDGGCISASHGRWSPSWDADGWLIKIDTDGNDEWTEKFGGSGEEYFFSFQEISDGYILTGGTESYSAGNWDLWLMKTDNYGNEIWNKTYGGTGLDAGYSIQQTSDDGFIIVGSTNSQGAGNSDIWLLKTDNEGNKNWEKVYGGAEEDRGKTVYQTVDGGYILAGNTKSFGGDGETWLIKLDSNGEEEWDTLLGGCRSVFGEVWDVWGGTASLDLTVDDGYIVTGTEKLTSNNYDIWIAKVDSNGNVEWRDSFGGSSVDEAWGVQQTADDGYIVVGATKSYGTGNYDIWLVKLGAFQNDRPNKPDKPIGKEKGKPETEYTYKSNTIDSDGDQVFYFWDWGDGNFSKWFGPYNSGDICEASYSWTAKGEYDIRVMAKDVNNGESDWSDTFTVSMPKTKPVHLNQNLLNWLFNRFPNAFTILRYIMG